MTLNRVKLSIEFLVVVVVCFFVVGGGGGFRFGFVLFCCCCFFLGGIVSFCVSMYRQSTWPQYCSHGGLRIKAIVPKLCIRPSPRLKRSPFARAVFAQS